MKKTLICCFLFSLLLVFSQALSQEHPGEHPGEKVTPEDALETLEHYLDEDGQLKGGFFIYDQKDKIIRSLSLEKIHPLRQVEENFYTCADFIGTDKKKDKVDLDFYLVKGDSGWDITKIMIHKVNGKERYKPPVFEIEEITED